MSEGLAAQISSIVRQHLADAHRMLGAMLARLDGSEVDLGGKAAFPEPAKPAIAAPALSLKPATVKRRERKRRAKLRQTNGADDPAPSWPELRQQVRVAASERGVINMEIAPLIGVKAGTLSTWLSRDTPAPSATYLAKLRLWLAGDPLAAPVLPPPFVLSAAERDQLAGHISLSSNGRDLRELFGASRELLEQAALGAHLDADVIAKLRAALANGAAAG
jgi:hypothetical protein